MFDKTKLFVFVFISLFSASVLAAAPDINVRDVEGKYHNINQHIGKGKWTVVVFWAHNCHICNQEIGEMIFFHDDHKLKDATVLGISMDGFEQVEKSKAFIDLHELNFPNYLIKLERAEFAKFGGGNYVGTPTFYLYNPAGELSAKNVGPISPEEIETFIKENS